MLTINYLQMYVLIYHCSDGFPDFPGNPWVLVNPKNKGCRLFDFTRVSHFWDTWGILRNSPAFPGTFLSPVIQHLLIIMYRTIPIIY